MSSPPPRCPHSPPCVVGVCFCVCVLERAQVKEREMQEKGVKDTSLNMSLHRLRHADQIAYVGVFVRG